MELSLSIHIIGLVMWIGGFLILTRVIHLATKENVDVQHFQKITKKVFYGWILSGFALTLATGLYQLFFRGMKFYFSQGWFHTKITFAIVAFVLTIVLAMDVKTIAQGSFPKPGKIMTLHGMMGLCFLLIVFLTMFGK